jgi:hypothetical protein
MKHRYCGHTKVPWHQITFVIMHWCEILWILEHRPMKNVNLIVGWILIGTSDSTITNFMRWPPLPLRDSNIDIDWFKFGLDKGASTLKPPSSGPPISRHFPLPDTYLNDINAFSFSESKAFHDNSGLETTLKWLESQHIDGSHLLLVKQWWDKAAKLRRESFKQTKITSFL